MSYRQCWHMYQTWSHGEQEANEWKSERFIMWSHSRHSLQTMWVWVQTGNSSSAHIISTFICVVFVLWVSAHHLVPPATFAGKNSKIKTWIIKRQWYDNNMPVMPWHNDIYISQLMAIHTATHIKKKYMLKLPLIPLLCFIWYSRRWRWTEPLATQILNILLFVGQLIEIPEWHANQLHEPSLQTVLNILN